MPTEQVRCGDCNHWRGFYEIACRDDAPGRRTVGVCERYPYVHCAEPAPGFDRIDWPVTDSEARCGEFQAKEVGDVGDAE